MAVGAIRATDVWTRFLLTCGILSSVFYIAINVVVPPRFPGYDWMSQTVSELSAIGAPTRSLWVPLGIVYVLLVGAFGVGILRAARDHRRLHLLGGLMVVYAVLNVYWPPMHLREVIAGGGATLSDTLHLVWGGVALVFMLVMMWMGGHAFGRGFRIYTWLTIGLFLVMGFLTGRVAPGIDAGTPTPMLGVWERVNIGAHMVWVAVLAVLLLRREREYPELAG